ncbi:MAG: Zinc ABC transporter, substrate-binding protein ZnuA [uncultured Thermomicrobiales bacterium]|uniref:Zinc ABC transporter, substrate-binding protein ZnuA n=1 Tax=uncultured Thermomicrobiales bacterium TaxID=1645740 RepID=A0A6J4UDG9_9BACT|nr:MAG: Zinc ABC transporter, substrate-binding protein ZnuA [uncultured Thermomicrobiales bacterium]
MRRPPSLRSPVGFLLVALLPLLGGGSAAAGTQATPAAAVPVAAVADLLPLPGPLPGGTPRADGPLAVVATTGIVSDLVAQVAGPRADVRSLLPANADPHDFEPAPEDLVAVAGADLVVRHGLGLDDWSEGLIENASDIPIVTATEGVETIASEEEDVDEGDPHVWFDPTRVETMVETITAGLTTIDPDGATTYGGRRDAYLAQLRELDAAIAAAVATIPPERRKLVTSHDAFGYFADRYGLTVVGTIIPGLETTAEPSAREIAALLEVIEREAVPAVFAENTASPALAEALAEEAGVAVVDDLYSDSLGEPGSGADTYLGLMRTDTVLIVEALQ